MASDLFSAVNVTTSGAALRDDAMQRAADHADDVTPSWSDVAYQHVRLYAMRHPTLTCEAVRTFAELGGFPKPPTRRAWGAVITRARREGILAEGSYEKASDPKVHCRPIMCWRSLIARSTAAK